MPQRGCHPSSSPSIVNRNPGEAIVPFRRKTRVDEASPRTLAAKEGARQRQGGLKERQQVNA